MLVLTLLLSTVSTGLLAEHAPARVLVKGGALAQTQAAPDVRSAPQLQADLDALERSRPSLAPGITLLVVGGLGEVAGVGVGFLSLLALWGTGLAVALLTLLVASPVLALGVVLLVRAIVTRRHVDHNEASLKQRLRELEAPSAPTPSEVSPPQVRGPDTSVLLAVF
jgi:hypothetical protein